MIEIEAKITGEREKNQEINPKKLEKLMKEFGDDEKKHKNAPKENVREQVQSDLNETGVIKEYYGQAKITKVEIQKLKKEVGNDKKTTLLGQEDIKLKEKLSIEQKLIKEGKIKGKLSKIFEIYRQGNKEDIGIVGLIIAFEEEKKYLADDSFNEIFMTISTVCHRMLHNGISVNKNGIKSTNRILRMLGIKPINEGLFPKGIDSIIISYGENKNELTVYENNTTSFRIGYINLKENVFRLDRSQWHTNLRHNDDQAKVYIGDLKVEYKEIK